MKLARLLTLSLLVVFAIAAPDASAGVVLRGSIPLVVNQKKQRFDTPTRTLRVSPGIERFDVIVPRSARGKHGIGINGGPYHFISGAPVKPGRETALTVSLGPGHYTVYDAFHKNRAKGFVVKVTVVKHRTKSRLYGTRCASSTNVTEERGFGWLLDTQVNGVACQDAFNLGAAIYETWRDNDYSWRPISSSGFTCEFRPFVATGLTVICNQGAARVVFTTDPTTSFGP